MQPKSVLAAAFSAVASIAVLALAPVAAQADSLVYLKGGEIWISHDDGSAARQVTSKPNAWAWPSESDSGTIVAAGGVARNFSDGSDTSGSSEIYRITQAGAQLGTTDTPGSHSTPSCDELPPQHVRVSPDGTKAAYDYVICSTSDPTSVWVNLSDSSFKPPSPQGTGQLDFYAPSWVDNSRFLVSHVGSPFPGQAQFYVHRLSNQDNSDPGLGDDQNIDLPDFQVVASRTGNRLAVFEADSADGQPGQAKIVLYTTDGDPADPYSQNGSSAHGDTPMCKLTLPASSISNANRASPTFSYDGTQLAWTENDGIHVAGVTNLNTGSDVENVPECTTVSQRLLIPGGSQPFFGHGNEASVVPVASRLVAAFSFTPQHPRAHHKVRFNGGRSHDTGGHIFTYTWSFGDGARATSYRPVATHAYKHAGRYRVTLKVTDDAARTATARRSVVVGR